MDRCQGHNNVNSIDRRTFWCCCSSARKKIFPNQVKTMFLRVEEIETSPFSGQKPGTSGLRKNVHVFEQPNYTENFVQATLTAGLEGKVKGSTLVIGGDGRYFLNQAIQIIIKISAANGVCFLVTF